MSAFTTPDEVKQLIGSNHSTSQLSTDRLSVIIQEFSDSIYDELSSFCVPFNGWTDDPPTPAIIRRMCQHLAAVQAMREIGMQNQDPFMVSVALEGNALMDSVRQRRGHTKPDHVTDETVTFGDADPSWDLTEHEALIGYGAANPVASGDMPNIIPASVRISANSTTDGTFTAANAALMRFGLEYTVLLNEQRNGFIFRSFTGEITDHITTLKIGYDWNYVRNITVSRRKVVLFNG